MEIKGVDLKETEKIEITSLMDNTVDFLSTSTRKEVQPFRHWAKANTALPFAEHGFSMIIRVLSGDKVCTILFDTGVSPDGVVINAERMGINLCDVAYVVLSHGHYDHFGGLPAVVRAINRRDLPIIAHEEMVKRRATINAKGEIREYPTFPILEESTLGKIVNTKKPQLIADDLACVTGEIPRTVAFEKGLVQNRIFRDNSWQSDPLILDERALVFNISGKGLVIISGCAHAGIINTVRYAQQITGITKVLAVLGGFHLAGREFEQRIDRTVNEFKRVNPKLIVPCHCTGWRASYALKENFPDGFASNSVGNLYLL